MTRNFSDLFSFRIAKRANMKTSQAWLLRICGIFAALIVGGLMILVLGHNPILVYGTMIEGSLGSATVLKGTIKIAIPLLGAAVAITPAFKMRFWNIGAEGQIMAGAIAATYFALFYYDKMPSPVLLIVMFIAAAIAGAFWGMIPAVFRSKWGTNETLFTLMLNYVALKIESYLQSGPWKDPNGTGFPIIASFNNAARLPKLFGVQIGWIVVLVLAALIYFYLKRTKHGYEISVVGESEKTAKYAGMNTAKILIRTMCISGAIAGIVGFLNVSGSDFSLNSNTSGGVGFTAIAVAWLSKLSTPIMIIITLFLSVLTKGSGAIQTIYDIPKSEAEVLTGIILFFMLGCEFFIDYKLVRTKRKEAAQ